MDNLNQLDPRLVESLPYGLCIAWALVVMISGYVLIRSFEHFRADNLNKTHKISMNFHGKLSTYFGKWLGVLLLNIITLGMYSPWGTIRLKQYLYQHTYLGKPHFDFIANPWSIFRGRAIVLVFFIFAALASEFLPLIYTSIMFFAFLLLMPFLVIKAFQFKTRTAAFGNLSFTFMGGFTGAFVSFVLGYTVAILSLGFAIPFATKAKTEYFLNHTYWGDKRLKVALPLGGLYNIYLKAILSILVITILCVLAILSLRYVFTLDQHNPTHVFIFNQVSALSILVFIVSILAARLTYCWCVYRNTYNHLHIKGIGSFECRFSFIKAFWLAWSNLFILFLTIGLAQPWTRIRLMRFFAQHIILWSQEKDLKIHANSDKAPSSLTDEVAQGIFDITL